MTEPDPIQVLMHPALVEDFRSWLGGRGLELRRFVAPVRFPSAFESFLVTPTDERIGAASEGEAS
jgi:hypothetical protein